jgi:cell division cycle 14
LRSMDEIPVRVDPHHAECLKLFHPIFLGEFYLASSALLKDIETNDDYHSLIVHDLLYVPFCNEFGPLTLADIHRFISCFKDVRAKYSDKKVVYLVNGTRTELTNGAFLLGCYMTIVLGSQPLEVWEQFESISHILLPYRDASFAEADFDLELLDCWSALVRASDESWLAEYDMVEYVHYDNPLEGDLHTIVPTKLIAFKGPQTLPCGSAYTDCDRRRNFAPSFYVEPFQDMNVCAVVRLNEREYADAEFEDHGIRCVSLEFDGALPPPDVVIAFLHTMRAAKGAVAVHCRSGLGRSGTLCALHLMLSHGFSACEAIAWVRIVRPGSIVGEQVTRRRWRGREREREGRRGREREGGREGGRRERGR